MEVERRLYFVSDIHDEMRKSSSSKRVNIIPQENLARNFLTLCGDIGNPFSQTYFELIARHSLRFEHVFIIAGNHEYYSNKKQKTISEIDAQIYEVALKFKNVTYLQKNTFDVDEVRFIGCTLWSPVDRDAEVFMTDYRRIYTESDTAGHFRQILGGSNFGGIRTKKKYFKAGRRLIDWKDISSLHLNMKSWIESS